MISVAALFLTMVSKIFIIIMPPPTHNGGRFYKINTNKRQEQTSDEIAAFLLLVPSLSLAA
jgi:hypothetical protein